MSSGVCFPKDSLGKRSTTRPAKEIWANAFRCVDEQSVHRLKNEKNWRKNYSKHVVPLTRKSVKSPELSLQVAKDGLSSVYESFEFVRDDKELNLKDAMEKYSSIKPHTGFVQSKSVEKENIVDTISVPFGEKTLSGDQLLDALNERFEKGELEADVVKAIESLMENCTNWIEELQDTYFVLLGATSELCPFQKLMDLGLNVIAVARPNPKRQAALIEACLNAPKGASLTLPVLLNKDIEEEKLCDPDYLCNISGADVLIDTPELRNWLLSLYPGKKLVIGSYIYLDGGNHVRASVAMDAILSDVIDKREDVHLMYLGSPAVVYPINKESHEDSIRRANAKIPWWHKVVGPALGPFTPNVESPVVADVINPGAKDQTKEIYMYNGIVNVQGPNYLLAKTLQNWRVVITREIKNRRVSCNMAPTASTDSVFHVASVARGIRGMRAFPPLTYYDPLCARNLMSLLMIYDICSSHSFANPENELKNPMEIFSTLSVHGGLWRCPYSAVSVGKAAFLADMFGLVE